MRSLILSQWTLDWRERRMGVIWQDLGASTTVRATELWICWRRIIETQEVCSRERITVVNFAVNDRGSNGTGS